MWSRHIALGLNYLHNGVEPKIIHRLVERLICQSDMEVIVPTEPVLQFMALKHKPT